MSKVPKDMKEKSKFQEVLEDNPGFRQLLFFGFYVVFFLFVILLLRGSFADRDSKITRYNSGYGHSFQLDELLKKNYHFHYQLIKNGTTVIFDGDCYGDNQLFVKSGNPSIRYSKTKEEYFMMDPNTLVYEKSTNPMEFSEIVDPNHLQKLFIHGSYQSRTEYMDEPLVDYHYEISTATILKNIHQIKADLDDPANLITAKVHKSQRLYEIDMDLTSYYQYFDPTVTEYRLLLTYSKYGEIEKLS